MSTETTTPKWLTWPIMLIAVALTAVVSIATYHFLFSNRTDMPPQTVQFDASQWKDSIRFLEDALKRSKLNLFELNEHIQYQKTNEKTIVHDRITPFTGLSPAAVDSVVATVHLHRADSLRTAGASVHQPAF